MRIVGLRLYNLCTVSKKRDLLCSSARRALSVCASWRGQRGATSNDVALCFDDAEQVFDFMRADGSIMHVCLLCVLHRVLLPDRRALRFIVFVYRAQWHTMRCRVLLCQCVVPALSAIIFYHVCRLVFHYSPRQKKKKILAFIYC